MLIKLLERKALQAIAGGYFIVYFEEMSRFLLTNGETENSRDTSYFLNGVIILQSLNQEMPALASLGKDVLWEAEVAVSKKRGGKNRSFLHYYPEAFARSLICAYYWSQLGLAL